MVRHNLARKPSTKGRRLAAAVLAIVGIAGLSIASAAQLNLGSDALGAGVQTIGTCQGIGTITASYTTGWNTTAPAAYRVSAITLGGVNAGCVGKAYRIQLLNLSSGALGAEITGTIPMTLGAGGTFTTAAIAAGSQQRVQDLGGISLIILG